MAGHSKWANTKHRKAAQDSKKGKIFTRVIREITVAARNGGEIESNSRLRTAVQMALGHNMTRDTIDRAIKRGIGSDDGANLEQIRYEGYGPGGVAVIVDCFTDNRTRTVGEVRHAFSKSGGNLGTDGSVAYLFSKLGVISYTSNVDEDALMEAAIDAGADDVITNDDGSKDVITTLENYLNVKEALVAGGFEPESAEITMQASTKAELDAEDAEKMMLLIERLEDLDDVQNVYSNGDISDEIMASMS